MKIGILVYSQTGNTLSVAGRLAEKLQSAGHEPVLVRISPIGEERMLQPDVGLKEAAMPDLGFWDALVLAAPVQGFALAPAARAFLARQPALPGIKAVCLVTMFFRFSWLGGNRAIRTMRQSLQDRGIQVMDSGVVNWSSPGRNRQIETLTDRLSRLF